MNSQNKLQSILVIETNRTFGAEISSRSSEVIHAGIYYPENSNKAILCTKGRDLLYNFCEKYNVEFRRCEKYIVSSNNQETENLTLLQKNAVTNGVKIQFLAKNDLQKHEKLRHFHSALWSPSTGIIHSHQYLKTLHSLCQTAGVDFAFLHSFSAVKEINEQKIVFEITHEQEKYLVSCKTFINAAALFASGIYNNFPDNASDKYVIKPRRCRYFSLTTKYNNYFPSLLYPAPTPDGSVGIHTAFDTSGSTRLGPDANYFHENSDPEDKSLYNFSEYDMSAKEHFFHKGKELIPTLQLEDLSPDYVGVMPTAYKNNARIPDFIFEQKRIGQTLQIHLLGMDSPALTSALAIGQKVCSLI